MALVMGLSACGGGLDISVAIVIGDDDDEQPQPITSNAASERIVSQLPANTLCPNADSINLVYAGLECLVIKTYGVPAPGSNKLIVFIHGDVSSGGPANYLDAYAPAYAGSGVISVRLLRPGYFDDTGATSTGDNFGRIDNYTERNIQAVAQALAVLRVRYNASQLLVVGHSGGAAIAATILGRHPAIIDSAFLAACPCDLRAWRTFRGSAWPRSLSPLEWTSAIPINTRVIAMTGTADTQVPLVYSQTYIDALRARNLSARQESVPGAEHGASTLFTTQQVQQAITSLVQ
jgi:pimeloyl-ACP methyl ester carboxylesterase